MNPNLAEAKRLMENGGYTCVLYKDGITHTSTKRGVLPLKEWLEKKTELKGFSAADKVVGKAAAFLYVLMGVREVYARVMSEGAVRVLEAHGIEACSDSTAGGIINRAGTGPCPMEQAVAGIEDPQEAYQAVCIRLRELAGECS